VRAKKCKDMTRGKECKRDERQNKASREIAITQKATKV
jgi:hypothetical protein